MSMMLILGFVSSAYAELPSKADGLKRVTQVLVAPPGVPEHKQVVKGPRVVQVRLIIEEREIEVEDGVFVQAMTFNGSVPGRR